MLKQAFSNLILEKTMAATQSYVLNKVLPPPPPPPPPPEEPYQYLPNPGPYATEFSWDYALGILGTMAGLSAAVFSFGALLGIGSSLCIGKRLKKVNEEIIETPSVDEYETWAQENYERREGPGQLRVETSGPLEPRNPDNPVVPSLP